MRIKDRTIFITGGSDGIGLALAINLAGLGNRVVVCGRREEALRAAKEKCSSLEGIRCDVSNPADCNDAVQTILKGFGAIDILINNAGLLRHYDLVRTENAVEQFEQEIQTNLVAPFRLAALFLPTLLKRPDAAIININSGACYVPMPAAPGYAATKAAMNSLSRSMRLQLRDTTVKLFQVYPPVVDTEMARVVPVNGGGKKTSPQEFAKRVMQGLRRDELEMRVGLSKLSYYATRFLPSLVDRRVEKDYLLARKASPQSP